MLAAISKISSEGLVTPHAVTLGSAWHPKLEQQEGFLACFCSLLSFLPLSLPHSYSISILIALRFSDPHSLLPLLTNTQQQVWCMPATEKDVFTS